jgi:hypothetical protein
MLALKQIISEYARITFSYWWLLLVGGVMLLPDIYKFLHPTGKEINFPKWVRWSAAFICLSLAQFLAYRNQAMNLATVIEEKRQKVIENNSLIAQFQNQSNNLEQVRQKVKDLEGQIKNHPTKGGATVQAPNAIQQSGGDCSPNQIGVNNTNNCILPARKLTDEQRAHMIQYLSFTKHKLAIGSLIGDVEAGEFATVLVDIFERSGWAVDKFIGRQMQSGLSAEAITLSVYAPSGSTTSDNQTGLRVVNALRNAGVKVAVNFDSSLAPDAVNLYVGARRPDKL